MLTTSAAFYFLATFYYRRKILTSIKLKINILLIFFFANLPSALFPQVSDTLFFSGEYSVKVDSIKIEGNAVTKPDVILRELTFGPGDFVTPKIISYNVDRVYSLGIFTRVNLIPYRYNKTNIVLIKVEESWYIYPLPFVEFQDRDWKKISYGLNILVRNFRGENETVRATAALGYDPKLMLYYDHPYFIRSQSIYFTAGLNYQNAKNKSSLANQLYGGDFNQKFITGSVDLGKRFGLFNKLDLYVGYNYVESPVYIKGISASDGRIDRQFSLGASYQFDTRDLAQFPGTGTYLYANLQLNGFGMNNISYQIANLDIRKYFTLWNSLISKFRFATRMTFGRLVPYYDFSYFGYNERIRGYFTHEMEGNNSYFGSAELNYPIIKDLNISFDFLPVIPRSLLTYRFAMYVELFTDTGVTTLWGQPLSIKNFNTGYGTGIVFLILPYSQLRTEIAFNEFGQSQFILGLGTSF